MQLAQLGRLLEVGAIGALTDRELLELFLARTGEEAELAFSVLVGRHGGTVLRTCQTVLGNKEDSLDAFQATFLILARKARGIRVGDSLAPWLNRVARHSALGAKRSAARRVSAEKEASRMARSLPADRDHAEFWSVVHQEVEQLQAHYRAPVVLCDLEGRSYEEAAQHLGCPIGTVRSRLARSRERLRSRLMRRGFGPLMLTCPPLHSPGIRDVMTPMLVDLVARSATRYTAANIASTHPAVVLAEEVLMIMKLSRLTVAAAVILVIITGSAIVVAVAAAGGVVGSVESARGAEQAAEKSAQVAEHPKTAPESTAPRLIEVTVRAKDTGKPLEGASIRTTIEMEPTVKKTGPDGRARIILFRHGTRDTLNLDVWAEDYVQQRHFFAQHDARYPKIPGQITIDLLPGEETLGGTVTDEQGRPIGGVNVEIWGYLGEKKQKDELAYHVDATTDEQGRWRCRCFRSMTFAYLYLSHPDFLSDGWHPRPHGRPIPSEPPQPGEKPIQGLRDFSDVQVLTRGVEIAGAVRDKEGKLIAGAEVGWLDAEQRHLFHIHLSLTTTDSKGRFRFPHARPGDLVLQVKAKGHAPELTFVQAKQGADPVTIVVGPSRKLTGRVVDSRGRPVFGASIVIDTWRKYRALGVHVETDVLGRFQWEEAPPDSVLVNASAAGFDRVTQQEVAPGEEAVFTLKRSLAISGRIRDANTKNAIDNVNVIVGTPGPKPGTFDWAGNARVSARQGRFQSSVDIEQTPEFRLRFRAKGYEPLESRTFRADERQVEYDVELTPTDKPDGVAINGIVLRPDGKPLADAEVAISYPRTRRMEQLPSVNIIDGKLQLVQPAATAKTDAAGRFTLVREPDPEGQHFALVVVHPDFFAEVDSALFEANSTISAKPWGRIEGVVRTGTKPAAEEFIHYRADRLSHYLGPLTSDGLPSIEITGQTKSDALGRFVFDRVVPGEVRIVKSGIKANAGGYSSGAQFAVKAGETTRLQVGGTGRPVVAKIALPPGFDPNGDYVANSLVNLVTDARITPSIPSAAKSIGSRIDWAKQWFVSDEGREYRRTRFSRTWVKLQPDGTIRVDEVPPGDYRLVLQYSADPFRGNFNPPEHFAFATKQFTIPKITGGRTDEPFDLGTLQPRPRQALKLGQPAPPFDVEALDGRRLKLEQFRGKYVLVVFWASWCAPCVAEVPELKAIHERFSRDARFAMIGLSVDAGKEAPRKFVAENGLAWEQGFLGEQVEGGVQEAYHVDAIPEVLLIDPQGILKAQGPITAMIVPALTEALKQP